MENEILFSEQDCRIINILHQIQELDKMIELHNQPEGVGFMKEQYFSMKNSYLDELNLLMKQYIGNYQLSMAA